MFLVTLLKTSPSAKWLQYDVHCIKQCTLIALWSDSWDCKLLIYRGPVLKTVTTEVKLLSLNPAKMRLRLARPAFSIHIPHWGLIEMAATMNGGNISICDDELMKWWGGGEGVIVISCNVFSKPVRFLYKANSFGSANGLSFVRRQAITWNNYFSWLECIIQNKFEWHFIQTRSNSIQKRFLKMSSVQWRSIYLSP